MYKIIIVLLFICSKVYVSLQLCDYVSDDGESYRSVHSLACILFTDGVSDKTFETKKVLRILLTNENFPKLQKNIIFNMNHLEVILIDKCMIETIEPGAFSNLPRLEDITISNNPLKTVSSGVFNILPSLQIIHLYNNKLTDIEDQAFSNLPNLKEVMLNRNNLNYMKKEWFTNTSNIGYFSMSNNSILKIPSGMFHGWKKVGLVNLDNNNISIIEGEMFKNGSPVVGFVGLHHNRIEAISLNNFPDSVSIGHLSITANLINFLPEELLNNFSVESISIFGNPFNCNCLDKILQIFIKRNVRIDITDGARFCKSRDVPFCEQAAKESHTCTETVDKELTQRLISHWKKLKYDIVTDHLGHQCAMFDIVK